METSTQNLLSNPNVQALALTTRDITERKLAEAELRLTNFIVENASVGIFWGLSTACSPM